MKNVILLTLALFVAVAGASPKHNNVSVKYNHLTVSFVQQPLLNEGKLLPLIEGSVTSGTREQFGVYLGSVPATSAILEILDGAGSVAKTLSVNDVLGKGVSKEETMVPNTSSAKPRRAENIYTVRLPQGDAQIIMKAIATGNDLGSDQQLIVTFGLKGWKSPKASLRVTLPYTGNVEAAEGGVIFTSKSGGAGLATSVFPQTSKVTIEKNRLVITGAPRTTEGSSETALLWLVIKGVSSSSSTDVKTQAQHQIQESLLNNDEPRLVVVNAADKERLQQSDTASYTIICTNIGAGDATNVVLGNPVPKGAKYIVGSATTAGTVFDIRKENAVQSGEGESLKWTLSQPLRPGEERIVSFKVVLQ